MSIPKCSIVCANKNQFIYPLIANDVEVINCYKLSGISTFLDRVIHVLAKIFYFIKLDTLFYGAWVKKLKKGKRIIFFDEVGISKGLVKILNKYKNNCCLYFWNIYDKVKGTKYLQYSEFPIISFDPSDCKKHNLIYFHNIVPDIRSYSVETLKYDIGFIGLNKGRRELIYEFKDKFNKLSYNIEIYEEKDVGHKYTLSYVEYLKKIASSRVLLEILQNSQCGETIRTSEALVMRKKLITNNKSLVNQPYYDESIFFIFNSIEDIDEDELTSFINRDINENVANLEEFYPENWVSKIFELVEKKCN